MKYIQIYVWGEKTLHGLSLVDEKEPILKSSK